MAEPTDTIRRVNDDQPMTLEELYAARATLDRYSSTRKTDVLEARRRVGAMLAELEPATPKASSTGRPIAAPDMAAARAADKKAAGIGGLVLVSVLALVGGCMALVGGDSDSGGDGDRSEGMAKVMCENFVEDRLKAPGSADFSGIFDTEITGSGNSYTVRGHVDAQNSFGAMLRSNYTCQVRDDGNDSWTLVSLTGLE